MFKFLKNRKLAKRLAKIGSHVEDTYVVYLNNNEPISFESYYAALSAIKSYRENTEIFSLKIYRVETYSL